MTLIKTICATLAISIVSIIPIAAEEWTTTTSGGSTIEVPLSFIEGPVQVLNDGYGSFYRPLTVDMTLRQYRVDSTDHPYVYLTETLGPLVTETTLSVNEEGLGVLSGHAYDDYFYAVCRRGSGSVWCIDMFFNAAKKSKFTSIVDRIAASFINDQGGGPD